MFIPYEASVCKLNRKGNQLPICLIILQCSWLSLSAMCRNKCHKRYWSTLSYSLLKKIILKKALLWQAAYNFEQKYKFPDCILSQFHNASLATPTNLHKGKSEMLFGRISDSFTMAHLSEISIYHLVGNKNCLLFMSILLTN